MTVRLTLVCAAAAPVGREVRFGDPSEVETPFGERTLRQVRAMAGRLPAAATLLMAPSARCRQTASALGWESVAVEPALRDLDTGSWNSQTLAEVAAADPSGLAAWLADPEAAPHGGESVATLCRRTATWLDTLPADAGRVTAVVDQAVARAAVVCALSAPPSSFWRVDVLPLAVVQLSGRSGRWNLRLEPVTSEGSGEPL
ncbi:histidine phosphatase family protein [Streptomyces sp. ISL-36]|uniref:histidine phosphatase family protein n=1 Tax=Streptomyces sp. ISL-36 TaxID=2819182 RepID=UPI001BE7A409|nr:histidine phosphatase family protein [Streptomyces sp. ISL-36]MBT2444359.1 histidine phosphatase family protein [Streptomyces sp. ISL-36]